MNKDFTDILLPRNWSWKQVKDISRRIQYGYTAKAVFEKIGPKYLRITDIQKNKVNWEKVPFCKINEDEINKYKLSSGDIVFARTGATVGKSFLCQRNIPNAIFASYLIRIIPSDNVDNKYMNYYFKSPFYWKQIIEKKIGSAQPNVNGKKLANLFIPIPVLTEQKRIVFKIDELFSQLDAGVESLQKTKLLLQQYRQSILKAAMEGEFTKDWREKHKDELEFASVLIDKILLERREKWEFEQLAKFQAKGKIPKNDSWKKKYKELEKPSIKELPELPRGWIWSSFEELAESTPNAIKAGPFGSSLKKESYVPQGYKVYGQEQVLRNNPFYGDYYVNEKKYIELNTCRVKPGDILISLVGTIGKVLILPEDIESGIINPRLVKLSLDKRIIKPEYIKYYLQSLSVRHYFSITSHGGTMDILNLTIIKSLPIPLPPITEQEKIVIILDKSFSIVKREEINSDLNRKKMELLKQSILRLAFEGKLIQHNRNDKYTVT